MSFDAIAEQDAIIVHAQALCGGRIYTSLPDDEQIERENGKVKPYILITFGILYPSALDRGMGGPEDQPYIMPVTFECWSGDEDSARKTSGGVRTRFLGFPPDEDNATAMELRGGGSFTSRDGTGRPTRFMHSVTMETIINMSIPSPSA